MFIYGAGGLAKDCWALAQELNISINGFIDTINPNRYLYNLPVTSFTNEVEKYILAIGDPQAKSKIDKSLHNYFNLIHKDIILNDYITIGSGVIIMKHVSLSSSIVIGNHVCLYSQSNISHDSVIGDYCTITPGTIICGNVRIGKKCWIGAGSIIKENIKICDNVFLGAGSLVVKNIDEPGIYYGSPVRKKE